MKAALALVVLLAFAGCAKRPVKAAPYAIPPASAQCPRRDHLREDYTLKGPCREISGGRAECPIKDATLVVEFSCVKVRQHKAHHEAAPSPDSGQLPADILIFGRKYTLALATPDPGSDGDLDPFTHEIRIEPRTGLFYRQEVLVHELIHGCYAESGVHRRKMDEEQVAEAIDKCLSDTLRRNPAILTFLGRQQ